MNTRMTTGMTQRNVLADLNRVNGALSRTHGKLASGREISRPSDDPAGAARALQLRESLAGTQQYGRNIADTISFQETSETALGDISDSLARVKELLVRGASDTSDPAARETIATEIDNLLLGIKENANAKHQGKYVFSGIRSDQPPYPLPEPSGAGVDAYQGSPQQVARQVGPGVTIDVTLPLQDVLGGGQAAADGKVLDTLRDIAAHLRAGDTASLTGTDAAALNASIDSVLGLRAVNGARQNRLEAAQNRLAQVEETTLGQLSRTEDADMAKTLIDFNSQQAAYQAALRAGATIVQASLMDFLR